MRSLALSTLAVIVVACAKSETPPATDTAAAAPAPAAPAALTLDQVTGTWNMNVTTPAGDSTFMAIVVTATPDGNWKLKYPDRPEPVATRAAAAGDSIVIDAGPYASPIRKTVQTTIHGVWRLQGDSLGGPVTAHYSVKTPDSLRVFRAMGTRAP
jgi:hypothetical protein